MRIVSVMIMITNTTMMNSTAYAVTDNVPAPPPSVEEEGTVVLGTLAATSSRAIMA